MQYNKGIGIITYDPKPILTGKKTKFKPCNPMQDPWYININIVDHDILFYYQWWVLQDYKIRLLAPEYGAHITVFKERKNMSHRAHLWKRYEGRRVEFTWEEELHTNGTYWWLAIECKFAEELRKELGYPPQPFHRMHITLGAPHYLDLDRSMAVCERFGYERKSTDKKYPHIIVPKKRKRMHITNM